MQGTVSVNDGEAYVACGLQGFGLIQTPQFMIHEHLKSGRLVPVLPHIVSPPVPISVAYLQNRHLSAKVRAFVDWVSELFGNCPYLGGAECELCDDSANLGYNTLRKEIASLNEAEALP
jgi:LysR family transcriptional regulator for bpeEF and oprC